MHLFSVVNGFCLAVVTVATILFKMINVNLLFLVTVSFGLSVVITRGRRVVAALLPLVIGLDGQRGVELLGVDLVQVGAERIRQLGEREVGGFPVTISMYFA